MELNLNGLETADELHINAVTQQATKPNPGKPKPTWHHGKKPGHLLNQCRQINCGKEQGEVMGNSDGTFNKTTTVVKVTTTLTTKTPTRVMSKRKQPK